MLFRSAFTGWKVEREYYVNDAGLQMDVLGRSTQARYFELAGCPERAPFPENGYKGAYIRDLARTVLEREGDRFLAEPPSENFDSSGRGLYHYYNELAAISVALEYGIPHDIIKNTLKSIKPSKGRMERFGDVLLNLVKNPVGLNQVISYISNENIMNDKKYKSLLFALSDAPADGMDVSSGVRPMASNTCSCRSEL